MAQIQIKNKRKTIDIMSGEEKLGEIKFNPDDTRTYSRFIELIGVLTNGKRDIDEHSNELGKAIEEFKPSVSESDNESEPDNEDGGDGKEDNSLFGRRLETIEDFENASAMFEKLKKVTDIAVDTWDSVCKGFNEIFGAGVCEIFTQGEVDPELLEPMIDAVMPFFKEARQEKTKPYLKEV